MLTVAQFLNNAVYDRLPAGLLSSPLHLGLNTDCSIQRRWCALSRPHWFDDHLKHLIEQQAIEHIRIQQAAEVADDAEEEDGEEDNIEP